MVLDNASIHHLETVVDLIEAAGALVRFIPPYSPDLNPIEELFSQVKSYLREHEQSYQGSSEPWVLISSAFASVIPPEMSELYYTCRIHGVLPNIVSKV